MISIRLRTSIVLILLAFVFGFSTCLLFNGCNHVPAIASKTIIQPKQLKREVDNKESEYQVKVTALENENTQLNQKLRATQSELDLIKERTKQKEVRIKKLTEPSGLPAKEFLEKNKQSPTANTSCDSLSEIVNEYME